MPPTSYYDRIVDIAEELARFTVPTGGHADLLVDRHLCHCPLIAPPMACAISPSICAKP